MDPLAEKFSHQSPYCGMDNNAVSLSDPTGKSASTHTDEGGNVVAVYDDGDNGVYMHQNKTAEDVNNQYTPSNTSAGGARIGEIGGLIDINAIYTNILEKNIKEADKIWNPFKFKELVQTGGDWDLKNNKSTIYGLANDGQTKFTFQGQDMESQDLGNHHFGAVGKAYGLFTENFMLEMAGSVQMRENTSQPEWQNSTFKDVPIFTKTEKLMFIQEKIMLPPYGDDPRDQYWIKEGFEYYESTDK